MTRGKYRRVAYATHRRGGKDDVFLNAAAQLMAQRPIEAWMILPEQEQARKAIWEARSSYNPGHTRVETIFPRELLKKNPDNQSMMLEFVNGSVFRCVGGRNVDSLVGTTPDLVMMSEAALQGTTTYAYLRPILVQNKGIIALNSTPRGKNWFYRTLKEWEKHPDNSFVHITNCYDTGVFTDADLAEARQELIALYGLTLGEALFATEYEVSFDTAVVGAVWGKEIKELRDTGRAAPCPYDPRFPVDTSWDLGVNDANPILFWQRVGSEVRLIDWYYSNDVGVDHYAQVLQSKPYVYRRHYAPHDIKQRDWSAKGAITRDAVAREYGIVFSRVPQTSKEDQIAAGANLIRMMTINVSDKAFEEKETFDDCEHLLEHLGNYRFKINEETKVRSSTIVHDNASHFADALMTYAIGSALYEKSPIQGLQGRAMQTDEARIQAMRVRDIAARHAGNSAGAWG